MTAPGFRLTTALMLVSFLGCLSQPNRYAGNPAQLFPDASAPRATSDGPAPSGQTGCVPAAPCVLPDKPCIAGATICEGDGTSRCGETASLRPNGTACGGGDSVCSDGVCSACKAGLDCQLPGQPCRRGAIDCASGRPECVESGLAPNGLECGQPMMVCQEGACASCTAGSPCVPTNPCHEGTLTCSGTVSCTDSGVSRPPGSACGTGMVCDPSGACVSCSSGMACDLPSTEPCKIGTIECSGGGPKCAASGNAPNGKACGSGRVCRDGACEVCSDGMPCTPEGNRCHRGTLTCSSGNPVCADSGANVPDGMMCGTNQFCREGNCQACTPGVACSPEGNPCRTGRTSCTTGSSRCEASGNVQDGRSCGERMFCRGGDCQFCNQGAPCNPSNSCKTGSISCSTGSEACAESANVRDGTSCGANRECAAGGCQDCGRDNDRCCSGNQCRSGNFECRGNQCVRRCGPADGQCPAGCSFNQDDDCKRPNGQGCGADSQCQSNSCAGGVCCNGGQNGCGGRCVGNNDVNACGASCIDCPEPDRSTAQCANGRCDFRCDSGFMKSGGGCVPQCGNRGQRCCGGACPGAGNLQCINDSCVACNCRADQVCQPNGTCLSEVNGICQRDSDCAPRPSDRPALICGGLCLFAKTFCIVDDDCLIGDECPPSGRVCTEE